MQNAAESLAMAVVREERRLAAIGYVLRRANCAEDDAFKRREMRGRDRRLREEQTGDQRRKHACAQTHPLKDWSHRRLSVSRADVRFRLFQGSSEPSTRPCGETTLRY